MSPACSVVFRQWAESRQPLLWLQRRCPAASYFCILTSLPQWPDSWAVSWTNPSFPELLSLSFLPWAQAFCHSSDKNTYNPHTHRNLWKVMFIIVSLWERGQNADDCSPSNPHSKSKFLLLGHTISISTEKQVLENECGLGFPVAINPNLLWHGLWGTEAVRSWRRGTKIIRASSSLPVSSWMHPAYFWAGRCPRSQSYVFVYSFICFSFIGCFFWNCRIETGLKFIM